MISKSKFLAVAGFAVAATGLTFAAPANAVTPPVTVTASTVVTNRPDNGNHGVWALDNFTRKLTVTLVHEVDRASCSAEIQAKMALGAKTCFLYEASIADMGHFTTLAGKSPNAGLPIDAGLTGNISGFMKWTFYTTNLADETLVPATVNGSSPKTGDWFRLAFNDSAYIAGDKVVDWGWDYDAADCSKVPVGTQNMSDSQANDVKLGHEFVGDILTPKCVAQPTPTVVVTTPGPTKTVTNVVTVTVEKPVTVKAPAFTG